MATPGMLVQVMAETLGIPAPTVTQFDRVLSENGLRSKSGRGTSAAKVTAKDAANLLIALMAAPVQGVAVRDAAVTCRIYGKLRVISPSVSNNYAAKPKDFANFVGFKSLKALPAARYNFSQALEAIIAGAASGSGEFFRFTSMSDAGRTAWNDDPDRMFRITVRRPFPWASFAVLHAIEEPARIVFAGTRPPVEADLWQERFVSYRTIRALGVLISGDAEAAAILASERPKKRTFE
jgi:hypothetical protein